MGALKLHDTWKCVLSAKKCQTMLRCNKAQLYSIVLVDNHTSPVSVNVLLSTIMLCDFTALFGVFLGDKHKILMHVKAA